MPQETRDELGAGIDVALLACLQQIVHTRHRRGGVIDALDVVVTVTVRAGSHVQLPYLVIPEVYRLAVEAAHKGLVDLLHDAVVRHECLIIMALGTGFGDVFFISRRVVLQDADNAVGVALRAVAVDAGGHVGVTLAGRGCSEDETCIQTCGRCRTSPPGRAW